MLSLLKQSSTTSTGGLSMISRRLIPFAPGLCRWVHREKLLWNVSCGREHHEKPIVNAPCSISGKLGSPAGIKGGNGFDQTYGAYGDQIIRILVTSLIFFATCATRRRLCSIRIFLLPDRPFGAAEDRTALPQKKAVSERFSKSSPPKGFPYSL